MIRASSLARALGSSGVLVVAACNQTPQEVTPPPPPKVFDAGDRPKTLGDLLKPEKPTVPPPVNSAELIKLGSHDPGWDLDPADPARDYVERYILSTQRYGKDTRCILAQASRVEGERSLVETRDVTGDEVHGCTGSHAVRDTFAVDVAHNRMALADPAVGQPLGDWPDGSGTEALPGAEPKEGPPMEEWNTGVRQAMKSLTLVPVRVQFYGRGSYPVVSVAGWHGTVTPASTPAQLDQAAKTVCAGSQNFPVGVMTAMDRTRILRIRCPGGARWETL